MTEDRKPVFQRLAALLAAPFALGREAIAQVGSAFRGDPPEEAPPAPVRIAVTPPPHAIKRRG